jgi:Tol biopolymer transport system component
VPTAAPGPTTPAPPLPLPVASSIDQAGLWIVNADGSSLRMVTNRSNSGDDAWSPDGTQIAFGWLSGAMDHPDPATAERICVANPDGTGIQRLFAGTGASRVVWGSGTNLAFTIPQPSNPQYPVLLDANAKTGHISQLATSALPLAWSADRTSLAWLAAGPGVAAPIMANHGATNTALSSVFPDTASWPAVISPDWTKIAAYTDNRNSAIFDLATGGVVTSLPNYMNGTWTPDGSTFFYEADDPNVGGAGPDTVMRVSADTNWKPAPFITDAGRPTVSSDGTKIAFVDESSQNRFANWSGPLDVENIDGSSRHTVLSNFGGAFSTIRWSPSGSQFLLTASGPPLPVAAMYGAPYPGQKISGVTC